MSKKTTPNRRTPQSAEPARASAWNAGLSSALRPSREWCKGIMKSLRPPPKLRLSEWADANFALSAESAAEPGRWRSLAYQRGIMNAITDPDVERVSVKKAARIGYTKMVDAAIGYYIHNDPCPIMVVQPTVEDAEGYSKEEIAPMVRDCDVLTSLVGAAPPRRGRPKKGAKGESSTKTSAETILHKSFPGGVLSMVGANSGRGFRRVSRRVVIFDEVDGYPASAGNEGDPIKLGERRAEYYWNRKIIAGSTPLIAGASRIEELYNAGDRRRFYVPCPHCQHMDFLRFSQEYGEGEGGHLMKWDDDPALAHFVCSNKDCGKKIEEASKRDMIEAGEWRAAGEFNGHASFSIWTAYSLSPNASWQQIAKEFLDAKNDPLKLKTFVNTVLGETWQERGEAPEWERLRNRSGGYRIGTVPDGVIVLTCGVDVQKDRFYYEVVGWGANKESWSIDAGEIHGETADEAAWQKLDDELLARAYFGVDGVAYTISQLAVDSGYNTQMAYAWARGKPRVMTVKGQGGARLQLLGSPSKVDIKLNGQRVARGHKLWPVGVDVAKSEFYGWLRLDLGDGKTPSGYCHFPGGYGDWYYKQITAEHMITTRSKAGLTKREWHVIPGRANHILDCRVYSRAAAVRLGIDRLDAAARATTKARPAPSLQTPAAPTQAEQPQPTQAPLQERQGYWKRDRSGWMGRRR
jgi:phage terminase large subunit GpA-like protein